jgi:hypothetical protein
MSTRRRIDDRALPSRMLAALGRLTVTAPHIQTLLMRDIRDLLHVRNGKTLDPAKANFDKLIRQWMSLWRQRLDPQAFRLEAYPLFTDLRFGWERYLRLTNNRWSVGKANRYVLTFWSSRRHFEELTQSYTLLQLARVADEFEGVLQRLRDFSESCKPSK